MRLKSCRVDREAFRALNKHEIDRRIARLAADLARPSRGGGAAEAELRPRIISARELIERMRPFIVFN